MGNHIRAIIFDFGGVIVPGGGTGQSLGADGLVMADLERRYGLADGVIWQCHFRNDGWDRLKVGEGTRETWKASVRDALTAHCDGAAADAILEELHQPREPYFTAGIVELILDLRARYRVGLLSNAAPGLEQELVDHYRIAHHFHDIVNSATVGLAKPDPRIYTLAADRLGVAPRDCFFTDDFVGNVEAARDAGMAAHTFTDLQGLLGAMRASGVIC